MTDEQKARTQATRQRNAERRAKIYQERCEQENIIIRTLFSFLDCDEFTTLEKAEFTKIICRLKRY